MLLKITKSRFIKDIRYLEKMVKKIIQTEKQPRLEQVVFIDLETTDLIWEIDRTMPFILQFSALH